MRKMTFKKGIDAMTRTAASLRLLPLLAAALIVSSAARAESDYEFARTLMDMKGGSFSTDDLVERLAAKLDESPATKPEATLIRAALKRQQAGDATPDKRVAKLKEAGELYKDVVAGDKKFRLYETAKKDSDSIRKETIMALIENSKGNPAEAKKYRTEAAAMFGKEADEFKAEAESWHPKFEAAFKAYTEAKNKLDPNGDNGRMPGPEIMRPLETTFDNWIIADKKYVALRLEQVESMDDSDAGKKKLAAEMIEHCKKRMENDVLMDFPVITSRYAYLQGRFYAAINDENSAKKSWKEAMEVEVQTLPDDQKKQILTIRKLIIHDLVKLMMKGKKYNEVEELMLQIKTDPISRTLLQEDSGKELIIDYSKAVAANAETPGDYEKALKEIHGMLRKEPVGSRWANSFARAMADVLLDARSKKVRPHLTAQEWYDAARGFHLMGRYIYTQQYEMLLKSTDPAERAQAPAKFEEAYKEFSNSVDYYRRAIAEARQPDRTDLATRLDVEPKAWFEMGLSYGRMKHDYEAIIAYKALRDSFLPNFREKWMPNVKADPKAYTKQVQTALKSLDLPKEKDGMVAKSGVNILIALDQNEKAHNDPWNKTLRSRIIKEAGTNSLDPDSVNDNDYILADGDEKIGRSLADNAKKEVNPENAAVLWAQAFAKYTSAAEKFAKVKPSSAAYDFALVHYANTLTQAQQIVADGHGPNKMTKAAEEQSKDLAKKALAAYESYEAYEQKTPTTDEKILARRKIAKAVILLAKNSLYTASGDWQKAMESADTYLAYENENPQQKSAAPIVYLNKFRALLALAGANIAPASDPYLKNALATLRDLRQVDKADKKLNTYMLTALSDRYNIAAFQLEHKKKNESNLSKEDQEKFDDLINAYEMKVAELQGERVDLLEGGGGDELSLDDYSRLIYLFHRTGQIRKAADIAVKMLAKFDPQNKNMKMPNDEQTWKPFLDGMLRAIKYDALDKDKRCKQEHTTLVDFMYDTAAGVQLKEGDPKRPPYDLYNENMEKALDKLNSIRNPKGEFADAQTLKVGPKGSSKSYLAIVEEEIQFRRKIAAARDLLSDMALEVAEKLKKEGKDDASAEYLEIAKNQIKILTDLRGESATIEVKISEIDIALGKPIEAMNRLMNVLPSVSPESVTYFIIKRRLSELFAGQNKWKEASEFPEFMAVTQGFNNKMVKERWPGMQEFLKQCYEHGVKMPDALKKKFEAPAPEAK